MMYSEVYLSGATVAWMGQGIGLDIGYLEPAQTDPMRVRVYNKHIRRNRASSRFWFLIFEEAWR